MSFITIEIKKKKRSSKLEETLEIFLFKLFILQIEKLRAWVLNVYTITAHSSRDGRNLHPSSPCLFFSNQLWFLKCTSFDICIMLQMQKPYGFLSRHKMEKTQWRGQHLIHVVILASLIIEQPDTSPHVRQHQVQHHQGYIHATNV